MNVAWNIEDADVERVCKLMDMMKDRPFVKNRQERNIVLEKLPKFSRDRFWYVMVACLLSTQQRSGPGSRLANFLKSTPFPLRLSECEREIKSLSDFVEAKASEHGLRRGKKVGDAGATNFGNYAAKYAAGGGVVYECPDERGKNSSSRCEQNPNQPAKHRCFPL